MSKKDDYIQKLEAQYNEWKAEIDKLKAKAEGAEADVKLSCHEEIENLREKQEKAQVKLQELKHAGDDAWQDLKAGVESAWQNMQEAVAAASNRFS